MTEETKTEILKINSETARQGTEEASISRKLAEQLTEDERQAVLRSHPPEVAQEKPRRLRIVKNEGETPPKPEEKEPLADTEVEGDADIS